MAGRSVAENWAELKNQVMKSKANSPHAADEICIIGVSKLQSVETINLGIEAGVRHLGENYVQEFLKKREILNRQDIYWHMIGPLQTNKAKQIVGLVEMIHTVDKEKLALAISKLATENGFNQKILIQVNIANEQSKSGVRAEDIEDLCLKIVNLDGIEVVGLMTMPPFAESAEESRVHFRNLRMLRDKLNDSIFSNKKLKFLSMGTSQDFEIAVQEGATHIRVGSTLFGERKT